MCETKRLVRGECTFFLELMFFDGLFVVCFKYLQRVMPSFGVWCSVV